MIWHIFIGTFKDGISEELKQKQLSDMKAMKDEIPVITTLEAGFSKGWMGIENQIVVTAEVATKDDFDTYMAHPYHKEYIAKTAEENLELSSFIVTQFEF